ncbi:MAG: M20/M25/M40 family metallo-hydrolase [Candidatus Woesearchaeota archaeon]
MNTITLLRNLVKIPSPSGEELEIGEKLIEILHKNFKIKKQYVDKNRFNVYAYCGRPKIILTTHMDTVQPILPFREDAMDIEGRGACDSKGSMAAMIAAAIDTAKKGYTNFGLVFDVDEENQFAGIKKAVTLVDPKRIIIGEPTNLEVVGSQKGLLGIRIQTKGIAVHGSNPEKGKNAIILLLKILSDIQKISLDTEKDWSTTINIGTIRGGRAPNIVASDAVAEIEFRTIKKNAPLLKRICTCIKKCDATIEVFENFDPIIQKEGTRVSYFTEMYFWAKKGLCTVYGPGSIRYAHSAQECVNKKDVRKAQKYYTQELEAYANLEQTI